MIISQDDLMHAQTLRHRQLIDAGLPWQDSRIAALDYAIFAIAQAQASTEQLRLNMVRHTKMQRRCQVSGHHCNPS